MAYGGGYLIKPVQSKNGSISELFLAGQAQVAQIEDKVREERRLQSDVLGKATDFTATGIQDMDNFWAKAGTDARTELMLLQQKNRDGEISRSQVIAESAKITGEMKMIGQLPTIIKEQRDAIVKESEKEGYSGLTLAEYDRTWFKDGIAKAYQKPIFIPAKDAVPEVPAVVATPSDISSGKLDVNGKPAVTGSIMVNKIPAKSAEAAQRRQLKRNYEPVLIDGKQHMKFTYQVFNQAGDIEIKSIIRPLSDHVNPSKVKYFKVDDKKEVATFSKNVGDMNMMVTGPNGQMQPLFSKMQVTPNGTTIMGRIADPLDVDKLANLVEQEVTSKDDDWYAAYAFDVLGARDPFGDGASGIPMSPTDVEKRFPGSIYFDYDAATKTGKPMKFTSDPLLLDVDEKGNTVLTNDTKRLVMSHYRNQLISSLNVETEVYKDRAYKSSPRAGSNSNQQVAAAVYTVNGQGVRMNAQYILSAISMGTLRKNKANAALDPQGNSTFNQLTLDQAEASLASKGVVDYSNSPIPPAIKDLGKPIDPTSGSGYNQTNQGGVNFGGMQKNLAQVLNITTFNDSEFKNITGFYSAEDANGQPIILLMGDALYGSVSNQAQSGGNANNLQKTSGSGQFVGGGISLPLTDPQAQNLYLQLFDSKAGNPEMVRILTRLGYDRKTKNFKEALHMLQDEIN